MATLLVGWRAPQPVQAIFIGRNIPPIYCRSGMQRQCQEPFMKISSQMIEYSWHQYQAQTLDIGFKHLVLNVAPPLWHLELEIHPKWPGGIAI